MVPRMTVFNEKNPLGKDPPFTYRDGIPAYILCAIATCSFISAFVCFLLTWRSRSQKWPRIIAAAVLYPIAMVYMFFAIGEVRDGGLSVSLWPLSFLLLASCGLMSAFGFLSYCSRQFYSLKLKLDYQKLAWLRGIIGVALTVVFCLPLKEPAKFPCLHGKLCVALLFTGIVSSIALTLVSCFCCCPSWKDDGDETTSIAAMAGSPTGEAHQGSPTVTNSNAGNGTRKSQGSPTVGNSNAGDGAQGDGSQGIQQGGANSNGQAVNYSGTDNNV